MVVELPIKMSYDKFFRNFRQRVLTENKVLNI